ncbi:phage portal protein [Bacillus sp. JJ722]|uniref:phage portal protein n=1 Tax=Bacillus sp. JJ722 TaxID=3122973 RepID=UPI002FFFF922
MGLFEVGGYYPPIEHKERIDRYRINKLTALGEHIKVFPTDSLSDPQRATAYIAVNLPGLICKKSADFLFGETPIYSAGKDDNSKEQKAIERLVEENGLNTTNYESAKANAFRGDSFYKIRWGQKYGGHEPATIDPFRVFIESQRAEYVFPETLPGDSNTIYAYHIAVPQVVEGTGDEEWELDIESHYPGRIEYSKYKIEPFSYADYENAIIEWKIVKQLPDDRETVSTGILEPLIVHVANYSLDDSWNGIDDLTENLALFAELDNRLSKIAEILDKHSDPLMVVPEGTLIENENGEPIFRAGRDKVFEVMDRKEVTPQYITWNGQLDSAFRSVDLVIDQILSVAELPPIALGKGDSGTSGASGFSIKWRMNSLISKVNRKRQYYDRALKEVLTIAQKLEHAQAEETPDYEITVPKIKFQDGLPNDEMEQATIANIRTGGKPTKSQLTAIMELQECTEEQARAELKRIEDEEAAASTVKSSVFNEPEAVE